MQAPTPLSVVARRHVALSAWLHGRFHTKLSQDDCDDLIQDALLAVLVTGASRPLTVGQVESWVRKAANNKALDEIRTREGRGRVRRAAPVDVNELGDHLADDRPTPAAVLEHREGKRLDAEQLRAALQRISSGQARVLTLRHAHGLAVSDCAKTVGVSQPNYERQHAAALRRLREVLISGPPTEACYGIRSVIDLSRDSNLSPVQVAMRDAHLAGCVSCRAYDRRDRGLLR